MKIVVTGGTGFLGRHLVWRLASLGHAVVFTGRDMQKAALVTGLSASPVRFIQVEHGAPGAASVLRRCVHAADAVVHCAALASPWGTRTAFRRANIDATQEVLDGCVAQKVPVLVHLSSPSVYFCYEDRLGIREDAPLPRGVNAYAETKAAAEVLVQASPIAQRVILRPRAIFGAWDNALLPRLLRLLELGNLPLLRGGQALVDLTYVDNVVDAVLLALALPAAPAHTAAPVFNIANGEPIEIGDLFGRIADRFGIPLHPVHRSYALADLVARGLELAARFRPGWEPPFTRYSLATIAFSQTLDLTRATTELGYRPHVSVNDGITRTAQWWRQQARPR